MMNKHQGILMSEEDVIFGHMDQFCNRIRCVLEEIISLAQFQLLFKASPALARPKREDLRYKDFQIARQRRRNSQKSTSSGDMNAEMNENDENDDDSEEGDEENEDDDELEGENKEDESNKEQGEEENNDESFENKDEADGFIEKSSEHIDSSKTKNQLTSLREEEEEDKQRKSLLSTSKPTKLNRYESQYEVIHEVEQSENNDEEQKESPNQQRIKNNRSSANTLRSENHSFHNLKEKSALSFSEPKEQKESDSMVQQTERLFETENRIEEDSKNILQKAQTLSREDIKIMSNELIF